MVHRSLLNLADSVWKALCLASQALLSQLNSALFHDQRVRKVAQQT